MIEVQSIKFVINKNGEQDGITFFFFNAEQQSITFYFFKLPFLHFSDMFMVKIKIKELENFSSVACMKFTVKCNTNSVIVTFLHVVS